ncbi:MAG: hydantoinase/oxoprolinase family protein [Alphaproteobacteria bacterium]
MHLFHSAGGMASPAALRERPLALAMSGPAAGVAAAGQVARQLGLKQAISFDMGGTTTDVCLILDGQAQVSSDRKLGERPLRQPMLAVDSIGAGGGSIARIDHGALVVGPESAGASPGPACYGRGGDAATVSDANLVLGYLDAGRVLGSGLAPDLDLARKAIAPIAEAMRASVEDAALGIIRVANAAMVRALRRTTVERGIDGRHCTLIAFGGAGPMHAADVAAAYGITHIVVPAHSGAFSALGCVSADMSYSQQQTVRMAVADWDSDRIDHVRQVLRDRLRAPLLEAGHSPADIRFEEVAAVRYAGQSYALEVADPVLDEPGLLGRAFLALHERLYGFATDEPWQLEALRVRSVAPRGAAAVSGAVLAGAGAVPPRISHCIFSGRGGLPTPRFDRARVGAGHDIAGPAIVEDANSTIVVPPGATAVLDPTGHLHIGLERRS